MRKRGFTLLELLVVIAIIGILSSIVMASLSDARRKAIEAVAKENLRSFFTEADQHFTEHGNYGSITGGVPPTLAAEPFVGCSEDIFICTNPRVLAMVQSMQESAGEGTQVWYSIGPSNKTFAISVSLRSGGFWCVDSTGIDRDVNHTMLAGGMFGESRCPID